MKDGNVMSNDNSDNPNYTPLTIHAVERWEEEQRRRTARYNNQNGYSQNKEVNGNQIARNNNQNPNANQTPNKNKQKFKNKNKVAAIVAPTTSLPVVAPQDVSKDVVIKGDKLVSE